MQMNLKWHNVDQWLPGDRGGGPKETQEEGIQTGMRKDRGGDYTAIYGLLFAKWHTYI